VISRLIQNLDTFGELMEAFLVSIRHGTGSALSGSMMAILHITMALVAAGLVVELFAAATAPLGFQDEGGFHLGQDRSLDQSESGNPS
jgi:hypothetical protein